MLFTYVPWTGAWDKAKLKLYLPEISEPTRSVYLPDDFDIEKSFAAADNPEGLFLPNDDHLSPRGAEVVAEALAATLLKKHSNRSSENP